MLKDGETDAKKGTQVLGPNFDTEVAVGLLVGSSTTYVAKAASANEDPIPVTFSWMSEDDDIASVDAGTITGNRKGMTDVTLTVDGRGIDITLKVTVHDVVKSIIASTGAATTIAVDDEIKVSAVAYDAAQDDTKAGAEGNPVPGVTFTWMSSNTDVATVDEDGMVTAVGVGKADITAHVGDIKSNKISVTVFDIQQIQRRIRVTLPITGTFAAADDSTTTDPDADPVVYSAVQGSATLTPATLNIEATVEQLGADGETWTGANGAMVKFVSLSPAVLTLQSAAVTATADGVATAGLTADDNGQGKVVGRGTARVEISTRYADTVYIEVDITRPNNVKP